LTSIREFTILRMEIKIIGAVMKKQDKKEKQAKLFIKRLKAILISYEDKLAIETLLKIPGIPKEIK